MARDIGGSDPERMAPPRVQEYVENEFRNSNIDIKVVSDGDVSISPVHTSAIVCVTSLWVQLQFFILGFKKGVSVIPSSESMCRARGSA